MSNNTSSILAAVYLDQTINQTIEDGGNVGRLFRFSVECVQGSMFNPLRAMYLMTMDDDGSYWFDDQAAAIGVPVEWLTDELLDAPLDQVIIAMGRLALINLSSQRNYALGNAPLEGVREDSLKAVETFAEVLEMNAARRAQALH